MLIQRIVDVATNGRAEVSVFPVSKANTKRVEIPGLLVYCAMYMRRVETSRVPKVKVNPFELVNMTFLKPDGMWF